MHATCSPPGCQRRRSACAGGACRTGQQRPCVGFISGQGALGAALQARPVVRATIDQAGHEPLMRAAQLHHTRHTMYQGTPAIKHLGPHTLAITVGLAKPKACAMERHKPRREACKHGKERGQQILTHISSYQCMILCQAGSVHCTCDDHKRAYTPDDYYDHACCQFPSNLPGCSAWV